MKPLSLLLPAVLMISFTACNQASAQNGSNQALAAKLDSVSTELAKVKEEFEIVKYGLDKIEAKAKSVEADIVIFGHSHTPLNFEKDNILYLNPGSTSLPRGVEYKSFLIMNIENNNIEIEQIRL